MTIAEKDVPTGKGVDSSGNPVIDPTKNVLDLVDARGQYQDAMLGALKEFVSYSRDAESRIQRLGTDAVDRFQTYKIESEAKRLDQLAALRESYDRRIADMLSESVRSTSALVSTQLLQIQSTFDARVSKLEEFRLTSQGRASVADPQLATSLSSLGSSISDMQATFARTLADLTSKQSSAMEKMAQSISSLSSSESGSDRERTGQRNVITWIVGAVGVFSAFAIGVAAAFEIYASMHR